MKRYVILRVKKEGARNLHYLDIRSFEDLNGLPTISMEFIPEHAIDELHADPEVQAIALVMPTCLVHPLEAAAPLRGNSWGIDAVRADISRYTGAGVKIAILDTGIDRTHPAFAGMDLLEMDFSGAGNGDRHGHGTHCAGTVFGRDVGQRIGVARGVNEARIGKIFGDDGKGQSDMMFHGLKWAVEQRVDVIALSLGFDFPGMVAQMMGEGWPADLSTSIALEAYGANLRMLDAMMALMKLQADSGISPIVVAAAGNESRRQINAQYRIATTLPAAAVDVISVAAVQRAGEKFAMASFSNTLATVVAPGVDVTSAWPGGGLHTLSGTSTACAHAAGVVALWHEHLQRSGIHPNTGNITPRILYSAQNDIFVPDTKLVDIGKGLISAPWSG
ncbi:MAG: S8 family serine peptidase [Comamonas sp.]|uniref:S8 family peptidase n=1 Tax=Comamonas sp. TaxID=34028 RepID=UPI002FC9E79A